MKKIIPSLFTLCLAINIIAQSHLPGVGVYHSHPSTEVYLGLLQLLFWKAKPMLLQRTNLKPEWKRKTVIRKSLDGGKTRITPVDKNTGILRNDQEYHILSLFRWSYIIAVFTGLMKVIILRKSGSNYRAFVISEPVDADLLKVVSWTATNRLRNDPKWGYDSKIDNYHRK